MFFPESQYLTRLKAFYAHRNTPHPTYIGIVSDKY